METLVFTANKVGAREGLQQKSEVMDLGAGSGSHWRLNSRDCAQEPGHPWGGHHSHPHMSRWGDEKAGEGVRRDVISGYNLKVRPAGFADGSYVRCERVRGIRDN